MNQIDQIIFAFNQYLIQAFNLTTEQLARTTCTLNTDASKQQFGDLSANAAMILVKELGQNPRAIAQTIAEQFTHPLVETITVAGPGFLNITLKQEAFAAILRDVQEHQEAFFMPDEETRARHKEKTISLEFVSPNPTGPLHIGHGRNAIIGDVLGTILRFLGYTVIKEAYVNDAGKQIALLGQSLKVRCLQERGIEAQLPEEGYQGEYLIDVARACITEHGPNVIAEQSDEFFADYAKTTLLEQIKQTLRDYGVHFDVWFSEKTLHDSGAVAASIETLAETGYTYESEGALWFKSTAFGDDKDRVVRKANGELTYLAADIAYMLNKIERGADELLYVLGQDHHSYVNRLQGIRQALGITAPVDVILYQLVQLKAGDDLTRMSKRSGRMITLQMVIDTVGMDAARFFYLNRKADAQLELDIELALKRSNENPVFYIQYAYVRLNSIVDKAAAHPELAHISADDAQHLGAEERLLIKKLIDLKEILAGIGRHHQTHTLAYYTHELASLFHQYYNAHRVVDPTQVAMSRARLALALCVRSTLKTCLELLGLSTPERM